MQELLKKINQGYDGLIREIKIFNGNKNADIIVSVIDSENNGQWINIIFQMREIKEFKVNQKLNFSNIVISDGIRFKIIDNISYIDFAPYSDEIDTIEDFRFSDTYFGCNSIKWKIIPYSEYQGQYEDEELESLYYNRFRYYDCNIGGYISQDPIGLEGNNPNFYAYVWDSNLEVDPLGLMPKIPTKVKPSHIKDLLSGKNVKVGSIKEADALLKASLPDAINSKTSLEGAPDWSKFKGKRETGLYHKDYIIDKNTGRIKGHGPENIHAKMKHINVKLPDGTKVVIEIEPNAKSEALFNGCSG